MKLIIFVFLVVCSFALPTKTRNEDKCGAVDINIFLKRYVPVQNSDVTCELCLDLVLIGETYAECEEAVVEHHMEQYCINKVANKASQALCKLMVDDVAHIIIEDTDQNPTQVCQKIVHKTCPYNN